MFKFFKKKENKYEFTLEEIHFFKSLIGILPKKYHYLDKQISSEFILGYKENVLGFKDSYTFLLNAKLEKLYINKQLPNYFILKDIKIWNGIANTFISIELDILNGMLGGFKSESINFSNFDFSRFDIENVSEKHFGNKGLDQLLMHFNDSEKKILSKYLDNTYEIILPKGIFYFIDNVGNGDVIALDKTGAVFLLTHDPAKETLIFSKEEMLEKLQNKTLIEESTKIYESF